jgi:hypothetical protein
VRSAGASKSSGSGTATSRGDRNDLRRPEGNTKKRTGQKIEIL